MSFYLFFGFETNFTPRNKTERLKFLFFSASYKVDSINNYWRRESDQSASDLLDHDSLSYMSHFSHSLKYIQLHDTGTTTLIDKFTTFSTDVDVWVFGFVNYITDTENKDLHFYFYLTLF